MKSMKNDFELLELLAKATKDDVAANELAVALGIDVAELKIRERCDSAAQTRGAVVHEAAARMAAGTDIQNG